MVSRKMVMTVMFDWVPSKSSTASRSLLLPLVVLGNNYKNLYIDISIKL